MNKIGMVAIYAEGISAQPFSGALFDAYVRALVEQRGAAIKQALLDSATSLVLDITGNDVLEMWGYARDDSVMVADLFFGPRGRARPADEADAFVVVLPNIDPERDDDFLQTLRSDKRLRRFKPDAIDEALARDRPSHAIYFAATPQAVEHPRMFAAASVIALLHMNNLGEIDPPATGE